MPEAETEERYYNIALTCASADEALVRAELLNVTPDKIPPVEKAFDFSVVNDVNAELKASGWKPTL